MRTCDIVGFYIVATLAAFAIALLWSKYKTDKREQKFYDDLNIGDKFKVSFYHADPFIPTMEFMIEITGKAKNDVGNLYVQYKDVANGSSHSETISDFMGMELQKIED